MPFAADMDGDGDIDLLVGGEDGTVKLYLNGGNNSFILNNSDVFGAAISAYKTSSPASGGLIKGSKTSTLAVLALPLIATGITSWAGMGTTISTAAVLSSLPSQVCAARHQYLPDNILGYYSSPFCADIDFDGDLDCVVGYENGFVTLFENQGSLDSPSWFLKTKKMFGLKRNHPKTKRRRRFAHPVLADFDNDGNYDLLVGSRNEKVRLYTYRVTLLELIYIYI
jgi:large repetitive protein